MSAQVEQRTWRVTSIGSTDAVAYARDMARAAGYRVRTVARVNQITPHVRDNRRESLEWDVTLAVVVIA